MPRFVKSYFRKDGTSVSSYSRRGNKAYRFKTNKVKVNGDFVAAKGTPGHISMLFLIIEVVVIYVGYVSLGFAAIIAMSFILALLFGAVNSHFIKKNSKHLIHFESPTNSDELDIPSELKTTDLDLEIAVKIFGINKHDLPKEGSFDDIGLRLIKKVHYLLIQIKPDEFLYYKKSIDNDVQLLNDFDRKFFQPTKNYLELIKAEFINR